MYGTERMVERMAELINGVWRGDGFPVDWGGVICLSIKRERKTERKTTEE
jgi:hypothetical protein